MNEYRKMRDQNLLDRATGEKREIDEKDIEVYKRDFDKIENNIRKSGFQNYDPDSLDDKTTQYYKEISAGLQYPEMTIPAFIRQFDKLGSEGVNLLEKGMTETNANEKKYNEQVVDRSRQKGGGVYSVVSEQVNKMYSSDAMVRKEALKKEREEIEAILKKEGKEADGYSAKIGRIDQINTELKSIDSSNVKLAGSFITPTAGNVAPKTNADVLRSIYELMLEGVIVYPREMPPEYEGRLGKYHEAMTKKEEDDSKKLIEEEKLRQSVADNKERMERLKKESPTVFQRKSEEAVGWLGKKFPGLKKALDWGKDNLKKVGEGPGKGVDWFSDMLDAGISTVTRGGLNRDGSEASQKILATVGKTKRAIGKIGQLKPLKYITDKVGGLVKAGETAIEKYNRLVYVPANELSPEDQEFLDEYKANCQKLTKLKLKQKHKSEEFTEKDKQDLEYLESSVNQRVGESGWIRRNTTDKLAEMDNEYARGVGTLGKDVVDIFDNRGPSSADLKDKEEKARKSYIAGRDAPKEGTTATGAPISTPQVNLSTQKVTVGKGKNAPTFNAGELGKALGDSIAPSIQKSFSGINIGIDPLVQLIDPYQQRMITVADLLERELTGFKDLQNSLFAAVNQLVITGNSSQLNSIMAGADIPPQKKASLLGGLFKGIGSGLKGYGKIVGGVYKGAGSVIGGALRGGLPLVGSLVKGTLTAAGGIIKGGLAVGGKVLQGTYGLTKAVLPKAYDAVKGVAELGWGATKWGAGVGWGATKGAVGFLFGKRGLNAEDTKLYNELIAKRDAGTITPEEQEQLTHLEERIAKGGDSRVVGAGKWGIDKAKWGLGKIKDAGKRLLGIKDDDKKEGGPAGSKMSAVGPDGKPIKPMNQKEALNAIFAEVQSIRMNGIGQENGPKTMLQKALGVGKKLIGGVAGFLGGKKKAATPSADDADTDDDGETSKAELKVAQRKKEIKDKKDDVWREAMLTKVTSMEEVLTKDVKSKEKDRKDAAKRHKELLKATKESGKGGGEVVEVG